MSVNRATARRRQPTDLWNWGLIAKLQQQAREFPAMFRDQAVEPPPTRGIV